MAHVHDAQVAAKGYVSKNLPQGSALRSKVALADAVEDPLEASPLRSKVALADSVEDHLEASPLRSKVALADTVQSKESPVS